MPVQSQLEVSVVLTRAILDAARLSGVTRAEDMLQEVGINPHLLEKPENRIAFDQQQKLWALAVQRAGSDSFGLQFARSMQPTSFGLLGYMLMNCQNLDDCLEAVVRYQFLAGQGGEFQLQDQQAQRLLCYQPVNPLDPVTRHRVIAMLAATVSFGRWLVGPGFKPESVQFSHPGPDNSAKYEEFFACPVLFEQPHNALAFNPQVTGLAIPNASEELLLLLRERADRLLESQSQHSGISARIASLLGTQLNNAVPDKALIATQLGMSERTLQRRLREEGTSFQAILDNTRHYLALELLRNTALPLNDIAAQLGFVEASAFYRAFKKWQCCTPGQYRESASRT